MDKSEETPVEIFRRGTYPIFKYVIRKPRYWRVCVMIDDEAGDIVVSLDGHDALKHWWGKSGTGEDSLRKFLVRAGTGYLKDKFSYGRNCFNLDLAKKNLEQELEAALKDGRIDDCDKEDIESDLANLLDSNNVSNDYFYSTLWHCDVLMHKVFRDEYDNMPRGDDDNREAKWFIDTVWPHLVELMKKELADEDSRNATSSV